MIAVWQSVYVELALRYTTLLHIWWIYLFMSYFRAIIKCRTIQAQFPLWQRREHIRPKYKHIRAPANQLGKSSRSKRGMNDSGKIQIQNQKSHFAFIILMTFVFLCVNSLCSSACVLESFFVSSFDSLDAMISFDICSACKFHVTDSNTDLAFIVVIVVCDCKWNDVENKMSNLCERFTEC